MAKPTVPLPPPDPCALTQPRTYNPIGTPRGAFPSDPLFEDQWALSMIDAPTAWRRTTGKGAVIAVIDTGVDLHHPDLRANLVQGIDLFDGDACPDDLDGHGTWVAGIAAAIADNATGVAGAAPGASIMPIRTSADGRVPDVRTISDAIHWAADHGAHVINISASGPNVAAGVTDDGQPFAGLMSYDAAYAWSKGAVIVASAGNGNLPLCEAPAGTVHVICAAAVGPRGYPATYSNSPVSPENGIAVQAPGGDQLFDNDPFACFSAGSIWSTVPPVNTLPGPREHCESPPNAYAAYDGTSASAPYVAAVAALLFSLGLDNEQVVARIRDTASNHGVYNPVTGYGIVDAAAAVAAN